MTVDVIVEIFGRLETHCSLNIHFVRLNALITCQKVFKNATERFRLNDNFQSLQISVLCLFLIAIHL